jgi:protein-S-isoprenylcysteine O-methyltransferase Ste14
MSKITIGDLVGKGPIAFGASLAVFFLTLKVDRYLGLSFLEQGKIFQSILAAIFFICTIVVFYYALKHLTFTKHNKVLVKTGPYAYVRHPRYSAAVFFFYPAVALITHSTVSLISTPLIYIVFKIASKKEELKLIDIFGSEYREYMKTTPALVPGIRKRGQEPFSPDPS